MALGFVLGLVGVMVVGIYGFVVPGGNTAWRKDGAFVLAEDSGARYLYVEGELHPVLNEASARLVAGDSMKLEAVKSASLRGAPVGAPVGIVGAPDALPRPGALERRGWTTCVLPPTTAGGPSRVVLRVGLPVAGPGPSDAQGVLVQTPDGALWLLWQGRRLAVGSRHAEARALGYTALTPVPVSEDFLDAVPAGPDLATPEVPGLGSSGPPLAGRATRVGQVFADASGHHYLLTREGLAPLTATLTALYLGDPRVQSGAYGGAAVTVGRIGPADLARAAVPGPAPEPLANLASLLPAKPPEVVAVPSGHTVCVELDAHQNELSSRIGVVRQAPVEKDTMAPGQGPGVVASCRPADLVAVQPGSGALVTAVASSGGKAVTPYLVTDDGVKYPIPSAVVVTRLGYSTDDEMTLPTNVLGLLPTGPSLDPELLANGGVVPPRTTPVPCVS
ncbi:type VII secretion protein EccB [Actinacidiphila guanduensis]|uniref:Type VII secretion protein EccB n=2 Tax=Actinacidiphila guanduensis TaxID=310781 RepID=A0A1H0SD05_9ACTN|nr:type VII secretion protein EccB [Actinacidiphila guanduensis]